LNLPEQQVEAVAFAWLANQTLNKKFNNSPDVTGANGLRILGSIHQS
jgi:anhydro-N-acetylmuramic acid kinase